MGTPQLLSSQTTLSQLLMEFKNIKPIGRVTAEFNINKIANNADLDMRLEHGDIINIPLYKSSVYVFGEVQNPGTKNYVAGLEASDYIDLSGSYGRFASEDKVIIIQPNGDTYIMTDRSLFSRKSITIYPGSIIYVPRQIGKLDGINYASTIAPIFSSIALSIASLSAINN